MLEVVQQTVSNSNCAIAGLFPPSRLRFVQSCDEFSLRSSLPHLGPFPAPPCFAGHPLSLLCLPWRFERRICDSPQLTSASIQTALGCISTINKGLWRTPCQTAGMGQPHKFSRLGSQLAACAQLNPPYMRDSSHEYIHGQPAVL